VVGLIGAGAALLTAQVAGRTADVSPSVVKVEKSGAGFKLTRNGLPYVIRGAGGRIHLETLRDAGGNSIRTWGETDLEPLLDRAHELGISVTIGIWLGQPRQGFNYGNEGSLRAQTETVRGFLRRYRNHPALLMWGIGNEMEGDGADPRIWTHVNELAKLVHQEDPNHPAMTVVAEIGGPKLQQFKTLCPDVDVLGINSYAGLPSLPKRLKEGGFDRPFAVTEFGPQGTWEVAKTPWGAPIEANSTRKADEYLANYRGAIASQPNCLGSFVFHWGQKQETTPTWFGMFLNSGERLGPVEAMATAWTGKAPANRAPRLVKLDTPVEGKEVPPGGTHVAKLDVQDPDGDPLTVRWEIRSESSDRREGGDRESEPIAHPEAFIEAKGTQLTFRAPALQGGYRVFAYAYDGKGNAATANVPFFVRVAK
jgi:hypothetical protein